jgi:hypothetical protein
MKPRSNNRTGTLDTDHKSLITDHQQPVAAPQLELSLDTARSNAGPASRLSSSRYQRRLSRAQLWFQRMRQIVDRACDWSPAPPPRPEQIWFANTHRQPTVTSFLIAEERQVCE